MHYPWIESLQGAVAVQMAAERGVFDDKGGELPDLLRVLLEGAGVLNSDQQMTPDFAQAWHKGSADILACCGFYRRVAGDVAAGLPDMIDDLPRFMERSNTFRFFRYDKAQGVDEESLAATAEWVGYLEALARPEAPILVPVLPLGAGERVLEIGGNTGITAEALGARGVDVEVYDLPAVCALGRQRRPDVTFHAGDFFGATTSISDGYDAVLFKSVLHDWPDDRAELALKRAKDLVVPNGKVVICERGAFDAAAAANGGMSTLANLVFASFYRKPDWYLSQLTELDAQVTQATVEIDMPFHILSGQFDG